MNKTLTIVFTVRIDSAQRLDNLRATMRYYQKVTACAPVIVLEADDTPKAKSMISQEFPQAKYIFVTDSNPIFHRTRYINEELKQVTTVNAAVIDADVVVPQPQLREANDLLLSNLDNVMVIPYDGRAVDHTPWRSDLFRRDSNADVLINYDGHQRLMFSHMSVGGAYVANVEKYRQNGWENENFNGWGCEDHERFHRLDILCHKPITLVGKIHHLHHPRGINSGNVVPDVIKATKREYCKVCAMMPDELRAYVSSWPWCRAHQPDRQP